ncbi:Hyoscyamine 6-dioxygenase [Morella rubra]|uniref:Hyoscyamine 6-dioxygenase n=1 Tax=Morella rubra TaxID=262757 RepID=A0A6A1VS49_9ROSI|nr:Hyoscyamine 6-dioxygenase [Morella rubra]KAB1214388.1 Hyoscyamine 6-dioxygenase [Morella rubra]
MDQKFLSSWPNVGFVPESFVHPPEKRPGNLVVRPCKTIPVVDLEDDDRTQIIQHIMKASREFGFFQVINHGVPGKLMDDTIRVFKEFHAMSAKEKASECSKDPNRSCRFYTSSEKYATEEVHVWRDALTHPCHPLEEYIEFWPAKPTRYREVVGEYVEELRKLGQKILELLSEGLGISPSYFRGGLSGNPVLLVNNYPSCPDPSLTLGLVRHRDPSLITILLQEEIDGLQVFKDGQWIGVQPLRHAFVVNTGYVLQIISNGKLEGAEHRAVTNSSVSRTSAAFFIYPCKDILIEPAKALTNARDPPLYRAMQFEEFLKNFMSRSANAEPVLQNYELHAQQMKQ